MPKSRSRSRRSRTRRRRGGSILPKNPGMVLPMISRYVKQLIYTETTQPKTRQLLLDSFIYANLVARKYEKKHGVDGVIPLPKYGFHTFVGDGTQPVKAGWSSSGEGTEMEGATTEPSAPAAPAKKGMFGRFKGGKRRRRSRRRSKSRKSRRKSKKSRKRKRSRRRRRR